MRVYFNTSALDWIGSEYLDFEVEQDPDAARVRRGRGLLVGAHMRVPASDAVADRARALERLGLRGLDALHVACAEAGAADLLVTTELLLPRRPNR